MSNTENISILLDPQIFYQQTYGGISRYYSEIFAKLSQRKDVKIILPVFKTENAYINETGLVPKTGLPKFLALLNAAGISTRSLAKKKTDKMLDTAFDRKDYDVFVPTYYDPYFLERIGEKPFVLTVYDMIHELMPQFFVDDMFRVKERKLGLMEKATRIIAVSENTRKDILKVYPHIDAEKIRVIYHGSSIKTDNSVSVNLPEKYILYVGSRADYKNFHFLVRAMEPMLKADPQLYIVAAGGGSFQDEEKEILKNLGIEKQVVQRRFEENELGHYYQNAQCFVFPSLYEGFGIPVLESMASNCPIILTKHGSFPEVAGDAGIYFDSDSENDLRDKITTVLTDEAFRKEYVEKGLQQVKKFNWSEAAEQCLQVYREAAQEKIKK